MSKGIGTQIRSSERAQKFDATRGHIDAVCPELAGKVKIRAADTPTVIEIPGIATADQIARLRQWLLEKEALRKDLANEPTDGRDVR
jgi:hypothetical protein